MVVSAATLNPIKHVDVTHHMTVVYAEERAVRYLREPDFRCTPGTYSGAKQTSRHHDRDYTARYTVTRIVGPKAIMLVYRLYACRVRRMPSVQ